jgi:hypothetical protein
MMSAHFQGVEAGRHKAYVVVEAQIPIIITTTQTLLPNAPIHMFKLLLFFLLLSISFSFLRETAAFII